MMFELAKRNNIDLKYKSKDEIKKLCFNAVDASFLQEIDKEKLKI
ncbi:hypothetical protein L8X28_01270 [Campylobacter sp. CNRCH_2016_0050h]|nr:hypothetical protein [Campylobacter sp. CNRCH_2016_0050h]